MLRKILGGRASVIGMAGALIAIGSAALHPFGSVKRVHERAALTKSLSITPSIAAVLQRSCLDCHSDKTVWPWYSYVAPVSWLVERDVRNGRDHVNFSAWDSYTPERRAKLLADMASAVKNHEMPLPQYTIVHRNARLSNAGEDLLYQWARRERHKIKAEGIPAPLNTANPGGG